MSNLLAVCVLAFGAGWLVFCLWALAYAMAVGGGEITIPVNRYHEGWAEVVTLAGVVAMYPWAIGTLLERRKLMDYPVPKQSVRFVKGTAALDTEFMLRPLDESRDAFHHYFDEMNGLGNDAYAAWWVEPWDAEHEPDEDDYVTREQWDSMYACAKAVGLEDGVRVLVDVTW